jgi:hypothetical protein
MKKLLRYFSAKVMAIVLIIVNMVNTRMFVMKRAVIVIRVIYK